MTEQDLKWIQEWFRLHYGEDTAKVLYASLLGYLKTRIVEGNGAHV